MSNAPERISTKNLVEKAILVVIPVQQITTIVESKSMFHFYFQAHKINIHKNARGFYAHHRDEILEDGDPELVIPCMGGDVAALIAGDVFMIDNERSRMLAFYLESSQKYETQLLFPVSY